MNIADYGRLLVRRGWIILLLMILAAGSAFIFSRQQQRVYRASQVVLIIPSRTDNGLTQATTQILSPLVAYLQSSFRAQEVIDRLQLDMLASDLLANTRIQSFRENLTIQIDVDLGDCEVASRIANDWGNLLVLYRNEQNQTQLQQDRVNARLQDNPRCSLSSPNVTINTAVGALLGLLLGIVIVFVLEYLESSIVRGRADVERDLALPVLSIIPSSGNRSD